MLSEVAHCRECPDSIQEARRMKLFVRILLGAWAFALTIPVGHSVVWIEASEPADARISQPDADDCQENRDADDSWADRETPGYQLFPASAGHVGIGGKILNFDNLVISSNDQAVPSDATRSIIRGHIEEFSRNEAFSRFHNRFIFGFTREGFDGTSWSSLFRHRNYREFDQLAFWSIERWYIIEWSGNLWIEPKQFLSVDEFHSVKVDLISKTYRFLRTTKPLVSRNPETFGNPEEDLERSIVTYDPLVRLLEASNERAVRTEWKIARLQLISLMKQTASDSVSNHRKLTACETYESSPETMNAFEQRAVAQLETNPAEKVVTTSSDCEIQLVGPLRAVGHCTKCHQVADGTLLGVFSYRLTRSDPSR